MAFKKGQSGNPSGRKPGVSNKITKELRDRIKDFRGQMVTDRR